MHGLAPKPILDSHAEIDIHRESEHVEIVKMLILFIGWCILFVLCWPLALLALIAYPFVWLVLLPFRVVGIAVGGVLALLSAIFFLPVRLLKGPSAVRAL